MFHLRRQPEPPALPQPRRIPLAPSFWDDPEFGGRVHYSSTGSWVRTPHGGAA